MFRIQRMQTSDFDAPLVDEAVLQLVIAITSWLLSRSSHRE